MYRSLAAFLLIYLCGLLFLFAFKAIMGYPDYVIPGPRRVLETFLLFIVYYAKETALTFVVAVSGHLVATLAAFLIASTVVISKWLGSLVRSIAYTMQAYPIIAIAPVFFIIIGDQLPTRLIITASICYFPLLLTLLGVLSEPVTEVEHFFESAGRLGRVDVVRIRLYENMHTVVTTIVGSASLAVVGSILAEFLAANEGIGYVIRVALDRNNVDSILVALLVIGIANWLYLSPLEWIGLIVERGLLHKQMV